MSKIVDITNKLSFDENPEIVIRDTHFEVNADAGTMLKIMAVLKDGDDVQSVMKAYELLFSEADREKIEGMKLSFSDFVLLVQAAMQLVQGAGEGEMTTHTTT